MTDIFPALSTVSLLDAEPGSIVKIAWFGGPRLAFVTDHFTNGVRSFVWLNSNSQNRLSVVFAENWQNDPSVMQYCGNASFDLGTADDEIDPSGRKFWDTAGVIVSIGNDLLIRAALDDDIHGRHRLVNIRNGRVYSERLPNSLWTFLSWQLWIRDPVGHRALMLTEFSATNRKSAT